MSDMFDRIGAKAQGDPALLLTPQSQPFFAPHLESSFEEVDADPHPLVSPEQRSEVPPQVPPKSAPQTVSQAPIPSSFTSAPKLEPHRAPPPVRLVDRQSPPHKSSADLPRPLTPVGKDVVHEVMRELRETAIERTRVETVRDHIRHSEAKETLREQITRLVPASRTEAPVLTSPLPSADQPSRHKPSRVDVATVAPASARVTIGQIRVSAPPPKPAPAPPPIVQMQPQVSSAPKGQALKSFLGWRR